MPPRSPTNQLKVVNRPGTAQLWLRGKIRGIPVYESAGTTDTTIAERVRAAREAALWRQILDVEHAASAPIVPKPKATTAFSAAVASYIATNPPRPTEARNVAKLLVHFQDTPLEDIDQVALDGAYTAILTARASRSTRVRAVLTPLRSIMRHAARRGWCGAPMYEVPKTGRGRTAFLRPDQARAVVDGAADHLKPLLVFLFSVGCRMSEALELDWSSVDLRGGRAVLVVKGERSTEATRRERHVSLPPACVAALSTIEGRDGRVFRPRKGKRDRGDAYWNSDRTGGGQIKRGWAGACQRAGLPGHWRVWVPKRGGDEQREWVPDITPHGTRHTWASWHYCVHRDLLLLKRDGDWSSVTLCERYAHLLPDVYRGEVLEFWGIGEPAVRRAAG